MAPGAQGLEPASTTFLIHKQDAELEVRQARHKPVLVLIASAKAD